jgi:hypothetical protein
MLVHQKVIFCLGWIALLAVSEYRVSGAAAPGIRSSRVEPFVGLKNDDAHIPGTHVPVADGNLHFYMLPVGQGDAHVIQCPNGDLSIMDLGSSNGANAGFWFTNQIVNFLQGQFHLIKNVIHSHNHDDHYKFIPLVLTTANGLTSLENFYISCTPDDFRDVIKTWVTNIKAEDKIRMFNSGKPCGPNGVSCGPMNLCPSDPDVVVKVLGVNLDNCAPTNINIGSIVFKITHKDVSMMFNGDFEDHTTNANENGPQKSLVDYYGDEMKVTVHKISHHGAQTLANKPVSNAAHAPKAVFVSANGDFSNYRHPRCDVLDSFIRYDTLCKPLERDPSSKYYCGAHPRSGLIPEDKLQSVYWCGEVNAGTNDGFRYVNGNDWAIYSTTPSRTTMNLVEFISDGVNWGFVNYMSPIMNTEVIEFSEANECGE